MLRLAVTTRAETFERMRDPLAARDINVVPLQSKERTIRLGNPDLPAVDVGFVFPSRLMEGSALDAFLTDGCRGAGTRHSGATSSRRSRRGPRNTLLGNVALQDPSAGTATLN